MHKTSLSPGVFSLITASVPRTPAADDGAPSISDILTQDYCLNWPILSEYFKGTVICFSMTIDLHTNIETCIQFQSPTSIRMQSYTYTNFARAAVTPLMWIPWGPGEASCVAIERCIISGIKKKYFIAKCAYYRGTGCPFKRGSTANAVKYLKQQCP